MDRAALKLRHLGIEVYGECDIIGVDIDTMQEEWNPICLAWDSCKQKWHWQWDKFRGAHLLNL